MITFSLGFCTARSTNPDASAPIDSADDFDPRLATQDGVWIAVWQSQGSYGPDFAVLVSRSSDAGASWSPPEPLHLSAYVDGGHDTQPAIASDAAGTFLAVWRTTEPSLGGIGSDSDLVVVRSDDAGLTWTSPVPLNADAATDAEVELEPGLATDGVGSWIAVWSSHDPTQTAIADHDILVARSLDGGLTWSAPAPIHASAASDLRSDPGRLHGDPQFLHHDGVRKGRGSGAHAAHAARAAGVSRRAWTCTSRATTARR